MYHIHIYICICILYIYIYTYNACVCQHVVTYMYGGFPRPATTKVAKGDTFYERHEERIPDESKTHTGYMKNTYPTLLGMLSWRASGYA